MILMDVGAVPIPAVLHRGVGLARMSAAAENRVVERCGGEALLQGRAERRRWRRGEGRASACRFPLPLLIASHGEAEEARRGVGRGINCTHSPHAPRLLRPKGVPKPPQEDVRAALGRRESTPGPGRRSGGPPTCGDVSSSAWAGRHICQGMPCVSQAASGWPAARCARRQTPALRLQKNSPRRRA